MNSFAAWNTIGIGLRTFWVARKHFNFRHRSPAHWILTFSDFYGPIHKAFSPLNAEGQNALEKEITSLLERHNAAGIGSLVVHGAYLEVVIVRR